MGELIKNAIRKGKESGKIKGIPNREVVSRIEHGWTSVTIPLTGNTKRAFTDPDGKISTLHVYPRGIGIKVKGDT